MATFPPHHYDPDFSWAPGHYLIVSPYLQDAIGGFRLNGSCEHTGWPNVLLEYCREVDDYPDRFTGMIDNYLSQFYAPLRVSTGLTMGMISFPGHGGRRAAVMFGPLPMGGYDRLNSFMDNIRTCPDEWWQLCCMLAPP